MIKNTYPVYIPENVDIDQLLTQYPLGIPHAKDYLAYTMHLIHAVLIYKKDVDIEDTGGYTILKSSYLQKRNSYYTHCLRWLVDMGIFECNERYTPGDRSKGYRFTPDYRVKVKKTEITTHTLIKSILSTQKKGDPILMPEDLPGYDAALSNAIEGSYSERAESMLSYLFRWISDKRLAIDIDRAHNYLDDLFVKELANPDIKYPVHRLNYRWIQVDQIHEHLDRFNVDDKAGRLHTLLTCLMSELRAFLTYDGQALESADIKSSQPYLSLTLLDPELLIRNRMLDRLSRYDKRFSGGAGNPLSLSTMILNFVAEHSQAEDVLKYREIVLDADIYEYFGELLKVRGLAGNREGKSLREFGKSAFITTIFSDNDANYRTISVFREAFPHVFRVFEIIKDGHRRNLACVLQNLEAEVVLHRACKDIAHLRPEIPMFTVHDSIATTGPHYNFVEEVLAKHLEAVVGAAPKIKGEEWDDTLLSRDRSQEVPSNKRQKDTGGCYYGYVDDWEENFSLTSILKQMGLMPNKAMKALRYLGVLNSDPGDRNKPMGKLISDGLFLCNTTSKFGIRHVPRVTCAGIAYLKELISAYPDLFPRAKSKAKK